VSGDQARHGDGCECVRCTGFQPGHALSVGNRGPLTHGAYANRRLSPIAREIADALREMVPNFSPIDEPAVRALAIVLARIEAAEKALEQVEASTDGREFGAFSGKGAGQFEQLRRDLQGWIKTSVRLMAELGLTPQSRQRLGLNLARTAVSIQEIWAGHAGAGVQDEERLRRVYVALEEAGQLDLPPGRAAVENPELRRLAVEVRAELLQVDSPGATSPPAPIVESTATEEPETSTMVDAPQPAELSPMGDTPEPELEASAEPVKPKRRSAVSRVRADADWVGEDLAKALGLDYSPRLRTRDGGWQ
jgi:hypothetical protein